jgi:hypothetical protein
VSETIPVTKFAHQAVPPPSCRSGSLRKTAPHELPSRSSTPWPNVPLLALVRPRLMGLVWGATTPSVGFLLVDEALLELVGVAGEGIVGLQHANRHSSSPSESREVRSARSPLTAGLIAHIQLVSHEHMTVVTSLASWQGPGVLSIRRDCPLVTHDS